MGSVGDLLFIKLNLVNSRVQKLLINPFGAELFKDFKDDFFNFGSIRSGYLL